MKQLTTTVIKALLTIVHLVIHNSIIGGIVYLWWIVFGSWYIHLPHPIGGDYYTGLTYATQFAKHLPLPPQGWLPFWNSGVPVVGGYQWLTFYLLTPLTYFTDVVSALNWFSIGTLLLFFVSSYLLFIQISKNYVAAAVLVLITIFSQASYYQLTSAGLITGSSMQWYLPLALFFLFRYLQSSKRLRALLLCGCVCGLAVIHHPAMSLLFVVLPTFTVLTTYKLFVSDGNVKNRIMSICTFISTVIITGLVGIVPFLTQMSFTEIASLCDNSQCWGIYPFHITRWLGWLPLIIAICGLLIVSIGKIIGKLFHFHLSIRSIIPAVCGLAIVAAYPLGAYFHLFNSLTNSLFPRRMFWALLIMSLVVGAQALRIISRHHRVSGWILTLVFALLVFPFIPFKFTTVNDIAIIPNLKEDLPNTVPNYIHTIILPKFINPAAAEEFLKGTQFPQDTNHRIDIQNALVTHWWNITSSVPVTRGYTSGFNAKNADWTYYLQTATRKNASGTPTDIILNRAKFLFDAFGIGYTANVEYDPTLNNQEIYTASNTLYQTLHPSVASPIIAPINAQPVLFVGDDEGYKTFVRVLSDLNFNSSILIPVRGPQSVERVTKQLQQQFSSIVLYRYRGNADILSSYVQTGGRLFIELGSISNLPKNFKRLLQIDSLTQKEASVWDAKLSDRFNETGEIQQQNFAPLLFNDDPWKIITFDLPASETNEVILKQNEEPLIVLSRNGSGIVLLSGLNLPFHISEYTNRDELLLFKKLFTTLLDPPTQPVTNTQVSRVSVEKIIISGTDFNGVYFKENYHPGWSAQTNNQRLPIFSAGVGMMYIPLPPATQQVTIQFKGSLSNWLTWYINLFGLIVILIVLISPSAFIRLIAISTHPLTKLVERRSKTLQSDEHETY